VIITLPIFFSDARLRKNSSYIWLNTIVLWTKFDFIYLKQTSLQNMHQMPGNINNHMFYGHVSSSQMERLARTDILVKDLYVENAYLIATVQSLEQHCHVLVQMTSESSSV
jgi:hypothetical protein